MDRSKTILVVEDDNFLRNIILSQLKDLYNVIDAPDGEIAWNQLQQGEGVDLVILDVMLPKLPGLELLSMIRKSENITLAHTPVIIASNMVDPQTVAKAKELGVDEYFSKSDVTLKLLTKRIQRIFGEKVTA